LGETPAGASSAVNGRACRRRQAAGGFCATTIAAIYRDRWEIELYFKTIKQHLKIKTFVGTSENAIRIQIWTALTALLLLRWLHHLSQAAWSFSVLAPMLRLSLFVYRPMLDWLKHPFGQPPEPDDGGGGVQLEFPFPGFGQPKRA
jgi:hypothetical protein